MPYPPLTSLFSSVENLCTIWIFPLPEWQCNWKMSKKDKLSEGSTVEGGGLLRPQCCLTPLVPAGLSFWDRSHLQMGKELRGDWLVHALQGAPLVFYDVSLGWKDWKPRMCLKKIKMLLLRLIYGVAGCWPWEMGQFPSSPTPAGAQVVPLCLFSVTAPTRSDFFPLSSSLNHFAYSHFSFLQHLGEAFFSHFFLSFLPHVHFHICLAFLGLFSYFFLLSPTNSPLSSFRFPCFLFPYLWGHATVLDIIHSVKESTPWRSYFSSLAVKVIPAHTGNTATILSKCCQSHFTSSKFCTQLARVDDQSITLQTRGMRLSLPPNLYLQQPPASSSAKGPGGSCTLGQPRLASSTRAGDLVSQVSLLKTQGSSPLKHGYT